MRARFLFGTVMAALSGVVVWNLHASDQTSAPAPSVQRTLSPSLEHSLTIPGAADYAPAERIRNTLFQTNASGRLVFDQHARARIEALVGSLPTAPFNCASWFASNYSHVVAGRAYASMGNAYAVNSNQYLGYYSTAAYTNVRRTSPGYFAYGTCPA